ncbi:MAG TPA: glutathione S-transferase C-terminal domain-containing protein [Allosphingosinicella sp.]|jgi:glutathione S-transferase
MASTADFGSRTAEDAIESPPLTMLTFAPMIDSETSRLVLRHYGQAFRETDHLFGWVSILALIHGGSGLLPLLHGPRLKLTGPRAIVEHFDPLVPPARRLLPIEPEVLAEVEADWALHNGKLAADVAVVSYYYLLPERRMMSELFARSVPRWEAWTLPVSYPILRAMFTRLLKLRQPNVDEAMARIRAVFDETDRKVGDGREFLAGGRLTLADLGLAAAAGPMLVPDHYSAPVPTYAQMPPALKEIVDGLRATPTAAFVAAIYARLAGAR